MNKRKSLIADKELYRLWYEFYRLALESDDSKVKKAIAKTKKFYRPWEVDLAGRFDPWWADHRHLFEQTDEVRLLTQSEGIPPDTLVLAVPRTKTQAEAIEEIRPLLKVGLPVQRTHRHSTATYAPTEVRGVKRDALRVMLDLERKIFRKERLEGRALRERVQKFFKEERYKRKSNRVPSTFRLDDYSDTTENVDRNIRRYRQKVRTLILNVAKGQFPGKY